MASTGGNSSKEESKAWQDARLAMVNEQIRQRGITNNRVLNAMSQVPRHQFIRASQPAQAYGDYPIEIGQKQTISQPYIVALMTALLLEGGAPTRTVLEIGTGSGYQTAVLCEIYEQVFSIERFETLSTQADRVLTACGYMNYRLSLGDGYSGWLEYAPYDAIVVTACATHVPESLLNQLNPETGRLVIPVLKQAGEPEGEQELWCYYHVPGKQTIKREFHGKVRFVPMLPGVP